jgi:hypothetical protein
LFGSRSTSLDDGGGRWSTFEKSFLPNEITRHTVTYEARSPLTKLFSASALVGVMWVSGCLGAQHPNVRPTTTEDAAVRTGPASSGSRPRIGSVAEVPVRRCGPEDSYRFVIHEFRCPVGSNPLTGNLTAARKARRGSVRDPTTGHYVDIYEIPCRPSPVRVYVDMYGCAEYEAKLRAPESDESKRVRADFAANRFQSVVSRCSALLDGKVLGDAGYQCLTYLPASLYLLGKRKHAVTKMSEICDAFPPPSPDSNVRARLILETLAAIAEAAQRSRVRIRGEHIEDDLARFIEVCKVPEEQLERLLEPMQRASNETDRAPDPNG